MNTIIMWLNNWFDRLFPTPKPSGYSKEYNAATSLERAAFKACDGRMYRYARQKRRDALVAMGVEPWF